MTPDASIVEQHPRLVAKCRELLAAERARRGLPSFGEHTESSARMLAVMVVLTAPSDGRASVDLTDAGTTMRLPRHIRRMKLHRLMSPRH